MDFLSENETVHNFWNFRGKIDYVDKWLLMESPIPVTTICILYLLFVLKLGPDYLKKRPAFNLNGVLIVYNIIQVVYSAYMVFLGLQILKPVKYIFLSCKNEEETMRMITNGMHVYFLAKISELLDTIFFVLRKKQNQVTFLHVYHHTTMVVCAWTILKFEPSYSTIFLGTVNSFVHVVMYTYYGLSAFPSLSKYLWWKKYITKMQLIQFTMVLIHTIGNFLFSECQPSMFLLHTIILNTFLMIFLFGHFYIKSYIKNKNTIAANGEIQKSNSYIGNTNENNSKHTQFSNGYNNLNNVKKTR